MDAKLKSLKVVELKDILQKANVTVPAKANKQDLIAKILGSSAAIEVYNKQQNPTAADDLVCTLFIRHAHILIVCLVGPSRRASPLHNTCVPRLTNPHTASIGTLTRARLLPRKPPRRNHQSQSLLKQRNHNRKLRQNRHPKQQQNQYVYLPPQHGVLIYILS